MREVIPGIAQLAEDSVASSKGRTEIEEKKKGSKDDEEWVEQFEEWRKEVLTKYRQLVGREKEVKRHRGVGSHCLRLSPVSRGNL